MVEGNPELGLALARRAAALWRGPALADVADDPFAAAEAARLDELRLECTEDELDAELELGRHEEALARLQLLSAEHPLRERLRERLALALYRSGRQSEALNVLTAGRTLLLDELGLEPGKSHRDLERAILNQDPRWRAARSWNGQVVAAGPEFGIDRSPGRARAAQRLGATRGRTDRHDQRRRLALAKTKAALELARSTGPAFANGAAFIELASISDPRLVTATIAQALGVPETPEQTPSAALAHWLQSRELLLVIDNVEHVIDSAEELVRLLQLAPRLTLLVTSRRVLHVSGEHVFPLRPLPVEDAVALFSERAAARDSSVAADPGSVDIIFQICRRLDCLPLAVELAAARSTTLSPELLLRRLSDRVAALGIGPRDAPARQQTLDDTLRWSTDLLSVAERRTLAWLSVFAGAISIPAAETVCGGDIEQLAALIDSSLLQRTGLGGEVGLSMLQTIREHAAALLEAEGSRAAAEARHASYYTALVEAAVARGPAHQSDMLALIDANLDNLRVAMDRSEQAGDDRTALRIATTLYRYFYLRSLFREGRDRLRGPLDRGAGDSSLQALGLRALSGLLFMLGDHGAAEAYALRGIEVGTVAGSLYPVMPRTR